MVIRCIGGFGVFDIQRSLDKSTVVFQPYIATQAQTGLVFDRFQGQFTARHPAHYAISHHSPAATSHGFQITGPAVIDYQNIIGHKVCATKVGKEHERQESQHISKVFPAGEQGGCFHRSQRTDSIASTQPRSRNKSNRDDPASIPCELNGAHLALQMKSEYPVARACHCRSRTVRSVLCSPCKAVGMRSLRDRQRLILHEVHPFLQSGTS
jgi:hypothetical protein